MCTLTITTSCSILSGISWWFSSVLAGVVPMLGAGYVEVNKDQCSDPLALFWTAKAYSVLFSQYSPTAISVVSPDKALYVCACVCVPLGYNFQESGTGVHWFTHFSHTQFTHSRLGRVSLISHLLTQGVFWGSPISVSVLTHAWKWQNVTGLLRLTLKGCHAASGVLQIRLHVHLLILIWLLAL